MNKQKKPVELYNIHPYISLCIKYFDEGEDGLNP